MLAFEDNIRYFEHPSVVFRGGYYLHDWVRCYFDSSNCISFFTNNIVIYCTSFTLLFQIDTCINYLCLNSEQMSFKDNTIVTNVGLLRVRSI